MMKTVGPLSAILALRFFGLFVVMPLLSIHAMGLEGATPLLVGFAVGGFALSQVVLQVPFGVLSDRFGRKGTLLFGLGLFIAGSLLCAVAESALMLVMGRMLQGAGAIGAVITAMISDLVREDQRTKAMAIMGGTISLAFMAAMIVGPLVGGSMGAEQLFFVAALCGVFSVVLLYTSVPTPPHIVHGAEEGRWHEVLRDGRLQRMNLTNFLQKGLMTMAFLVIPLEMVGHYGFVRESLYQLYIPVAIAGFLAMAPAAILAQKKGRYKEVLYIGVVLFGVAYALMGMGGFWPFVVGVGLFFVAFSMHEPIMQSMASRYALAHQKGAALGVFTAAGFLGTFLGGVAGGVAYAELGLSQMALGVALVAVAWVVSLRPLPNPAWFVQWMAPLGEVNSLKFTRLGDAHGVIEWYENRTDSLLVVKYDQRLTTEESLRSLLAKE